MTMAIANAVQRGQLAYVYDDKNRLLCSLAAGTGPSDGLTGYTSTVVNIKRGKIIYSFDENGRSTGSQYGG